MTREAGPSEQIELSKRQSAGRIDGITATIIALSRAMLRGSRRPVNETRGLLEI